jgi:hypothetical protein
MNTNYSTKQIFFRETTRDHFNGKGTGGPDTVSVLNSYNNGRITLVFDENEHKNSTLARYGAIYYDVDNKRYTLAETNCAFKYFP